MKKNYEKDDLAEDIRLLKEKQALELQLLRDQFQLTYESIRPINLIKNTLHEVVSSSEIRNNILNNVVGLATGYLAKKILLGASHNPVKKILGTIFQFAIASAVAKRKETAIETAEREPVYHL
jgi:hypothetical protein